MAALCEVTTGAFYNWLHGASLPPRRQAERLAKKLNRPDLVDIIDRQRAAKKRRGARS